MLTVTEQVLYAVFNYLPYILLALYPFRNSLRYSKRITALLVTAVILLNVSLQLVGRFTQNFYIEILCYIATLLGFVFYFWAVKVVWGQLLFNLLAISNISYFIVSISKCIEGQLFPDMALQGYRWTFTLIMVIVQLIILLPLFPILNKYYFKRVNNSSNLYVWRYLWLVPATFYLIWYYSFYHASVKSSLEVAMDPTNAFFQSFIFIGQLLNYCCTAKMVSSYANGLALEEENHHLAMQSLHYKYVQERINEIRVIKHDMRHHLTVLCSYADSGDYESLTSYLHEYTTMLPEDGSIVYCSNPTLNMLLVYYAQLCKSTNISFDAKLGIPSSLPLSDSELAVLFGNLLENAYDACKVQMSTKRCMCIRGSMQNGKIMFSIENTYENTLKKNAQGVYLSTKHKGTGIGLESSRQTVEHLNGSLSVRTIDNLFCVFIILPAA